MTGPFLIIVEILEQLVVLGRRIRHWPGPLCVSRADINVNGLDFPRAFRGKSSGLWCVHGDGVLDATLDPSVPPP